MENHSAIKYRLVSISGEKYSTIPEGLDASAITEESLQFQYKVGTVVRLEENTISVGLSIRFRLDNSIIFEAGADFNYFVSSIDAVMDVDLENRKLSMKVNILPTLLADSYSSLRGIVYVRTLGTPLQKFPIPMIDTNTLLSKNGISVME